MEARLARAAARVHLKAFADAVDDFNFVLKVAPTAEPEWFIDRAHALAAINPPRYEEALKGLAIHVSTTEIRKIVRADANLSQGLVSDQLPTLLTEQLHDHTRRLVERQLAKAAAAGSDEAVPASQSAERFKEIAAIIRTQVNRTLDALPQRPVGISVDARTQQVKEVNQGGSFCLSLKLNVTEEGLDMVFEDSEPGQDKLPALSRLVPE